MLSRLFILCFLLLGALNCFATKEHSKESIGVQGPKKNYKVGVFEHHPFCIIEDGKYSGIAVDLWERVATSLGIDFTYYPLESKEPSEMLNEFIKKRYDVAIGSFAPVIHFFKKTDSFKDISYSRPYFVDRIGVLENKSFSHFIVTFTKLFTASVGFWILILSIIFIVYVIIWWQFEREHIQEKPVEDVPETFLKGIHYTMWIYLSKNRAGVPETWWGKLSLISWIAGSYVIMLLLSSSVISFMTTSLQDAQTQFIRTSDLEKIRLIAIKGHLETMISQTRGLTPGKVTDFEEGISELTNNKADAFIISSAHADYYLRESGDQNLSLAPVTIQYLLYSFVFQKESALESQVDQVLVEFHMNGSSQGICRSYLSQHVIGCL